MTRISFLMPTFNRAHLIAESITSVAAQMSPDDELIVVDDGSDDGTAEVLNDVASTHRVVRQDNSGKAVALNRGLEQSQGEYVWICDDDDLLRPGAVNRLLAALVKSKADMAFARYTRFTERDGERQDLGTGYWPDLSQGSIARHVLEDSFVMQNATLARRRAYEQVGPFDETLLRSLDYDMAVRLAILVRCVHEDFIAFDQRKHEGARGPASIRHSAGASDNVWLDYDRRIFERIRDLIPMSFYRSMFTHTDPRLIKRAAHIQRGCILARHDLWADAVADFEMAKSLAPTVALGQVERDCLRRAVSGKHGIPGALEPAIVQRLKTMRNGPGLSEELVMTLLRGTLWRLRGEDIAARSDAKELLVQVLGLTGFARLSAAHLAEKVVRRNDNGIIEERDISPLTFENPRDMWNVDRSDSPRPARQGG